MENAAIWPEFTVWLHRKVMTQDVRVKMQNQLIYSWYTLCNVHMTVNQDIQKTPVKDSVTAFVFSVS